MEKRPNEPRQADLRTAVEGLEGRARVEGHDLGEALRDEQGMPVLADHELGPRPVELDDRVAQAEAVRVAVRRAEKLALDEAGRLRAERVGPPDLAEEPGLDAEHVERVPGVDVRAVRVEADGLGIEEVMALAETHGLPRVVENVGLEESGERDSEGRAGGFRLGEGESRKK